jgi:hypothetical protein
VATAAVAGAVTDTAILLSAIVHLALVLYRADQRARERRERGSRREKK